MAGPSGENEIEFITRLVAAGDEAAVLREIGERGYQGLVDALGRRGIQLPEINAADFEANFAGIMQRLQQRSLEASRQVGAAWRDAYAQAANPLALGTESEVAQERQLQAILAQRRALATYAPNLQSSAEATYQPNIAAGLQREAELRAQLTREIEGMTAAERQLIVTESRLQAAMEQGDRIAILTAQNRYDSARRAVAAEERQTRAAAQPGGFASNFLGGLTTGSGLFHEADDPNGPNAFKRIGGETGEFLGAIARYQAAYAVIFGLSRAFSSILSAETQAEDASIEFSHATQLGSDSAQRYAASLGDIVAAAGEGVAQAMETATRGIFAFSAQIDALPEGDRSAARQRVGELSAQAAAMAQLLTGAKDLNVVQGQVIGTTLGLNLGVEGQARVLDAAANAARNYGVGIDQVLAGLPTVAVEAQRAGLSVEQLSNIIAAATARTGGSGTTAASTLDRVLNQIDQTPTVRPVLAGLGVDTTGPSGQVLESLAARWQRLSNAQQEQAIAALGGVRVVKELLPVLQDGNRLVENNAKSYEGAGLATQLYYARLQTLGGFVRTLHGDLAGLAYELGRAGALNLFGGLVEGADLIVRSVNDLLKLVNLIPGGVRDWVVPLAEVLAILTLIGRAMARNAAIQAATTVEAEAQEGAQVVGGTAGLFSRLRGRGGIAGQLPEEAAAARSGIGLGEAFGALGGALLGPTGAVLAIGGLAIAADSAYHAIQHEAEARKQAADALSNVRNARSADDLHAAATQLGDAIEELKHAGGGVFGGLFYGGNTEQIAQLQQQKQFAVTMAAEIEREQAQLASGRSPIGAFFSNTGNWANDLANGIADMQHAGVPAVRQLQLLTEAIRATGEAAGGADRLPGATPLATPGAYGTKEFVAGAVEAVTGALAQRLKSVTPDDFKSVYDATYGGPPPPPGADQRVVGEARRQRRQAALTPQDLADQLAEIGVLQDPNAMRAALEAALSKEHVGPQTLLTAGLQQRIANDVIDSLGISQQFVGKARTDLQDAILSALAKTADTQAGQPIPQLRDQATFDQFVTGLDKSGKPTAAGSLDQYLKGLAQFDDPRQQDPTLARLQAQTTYLRTLATQAQQQGLGGVALEELLTLLHQSQHDLTVAAVAHLEALRKAAEAATGGDPTAIVNVERNYVMREVRVALAQGDTGELVAILDTADKATISAVRHAIDLEYRTALDSYNHAQAIYDQAKAEWAKLPAALKGDQGAPVAPSDAGLRAAKGAKTAIDQATTGPAATVVPTDASTSADLTQLAQNRILAEARSGDPVSEARAQLAAAEYARDHAKNQADYWAAVKQVNDAERTLTQAISSYQQAVDSAHVRPGNQVSAAAAAVQVATLALNSALTGTADWWNAFKQLQDAQYALAQANLEHAHQVRLTKIDQTDPVAVAQEELRQAQAKLSYDQRHGAGDTAADRATVDAANSRAQAAVFDQRLHDAQVAHDLGTLSDAAYLKFLESQRDRLQAIKNKTRQQIEELQQIDQAIKAEADQMQGQWNIGDIRIPTPYEARRYIQATGQGQSYQSTSITNTDNRRFDFRGLDKTEIIALLTAVLGADATSTTATTPRKT